MEPGFIGSLLEVWVLHAVMDTEMIRKENKIDIPSTVLRTLRPSHVSLSYNLYEFWEEEQFTVIREKLKREKNIFKKNPLLP